MCSRFPKLYWVLTIWGLLSFREGSAHAHHGASTALGGGGASQAPLSPRAQLAIANTRVELTHRLTRVQEQRTFTNPLPEDALWLSQELALAYAPLPWLEISAMVPLLHRFPLEQRRANQRPSARSGLGDTRLGVRGAPWIQSERRSALLIGSEFSLPTGEDTPGFGTDTFSGRLSLTYLSYLGGSEWVASAEGGFAASFQRDGQIAFDMAAAIASAPWLSALRVMVAMQSRTFLHSGERALSAFASQRRKAGDTEIELAPAFLWSMTAQSLLYLRATLPLTRTKIAQWQASIGLQYGF